MAKLQMELDQKHKEVIQYLAKQQNLKFPKVYSSAINFLVLTASAMNNGDNPKFPVYQLDEKATEDQQQSPDIIIVNSIFLEYCKHKLPPGVFGSNETKYMNPYHQLELTDVPYRFQVTELREDIKQKIGWLKEWSGEKSGKGVSLDALLSHNLHFSLLNKGYDFAYK